MNAAIQMTSTPMTDSELDAEFDTAPKYEAVPDSSPISSPRPVAPPVDRAAASAAYPDLSNVTVTKLPHKNMILDGVCSHCAHCGQQLTDSVSVQRGIGPICSKRGYSEDPVEADEMQAMIDIAEFPELVKFLVDHYKPLGIQGLVNGLVRVASLNRPRGRGQSLGNRQLFMSICDAVNSLGHRKMAEVLRNTLVVATVTDDESNPGCVLVHVKFRDLPSGWSGTVRGAIWGARFDKEKKSWIIPIHHPQDAARKAMSHVRVEGSQDEYLTNKKALWGLFVANFPGMSVKTKTGVAKIK